MTLFEDAQGNTGLLSEYIPNLNPVDMPNKVATADFAADVWLGNWDAVCSDNLQTDGLKQYRIDFGGALKYRARGGNKNFTRVPFEITTLINPEINPQSSYMFSKMTRDDLISSLKKVVSCSDDDISRLAKQCYPDKNTEHIVQTLIKRKEFLKYTLELAEKTASDNKTMFQYLTGIQEKVLNTPLWEFDSYQGKLTKPKDFFEDDISSKFCRKNKTSKKIQQMVTQRNKIQFQDENRSLDEFLAAEIKDSCGQNVNTSIRWGLTAQEDSRLEQLDSILAQTSLPEMTLYRGGSYRDLNVDCAVNSSDFFDKVFQRGQCFEIPIYSNSSLSKEIAQEFIGDYSNKIIWQFNVPKGTKGIWMEDLTSGQTEIKLMNEQEVLLQRNLPCKFKKRIPYFTHELIEVDVLNNPKRHQIVDLKAKYFENKI